METNYENFIYYLQTNEIRFENNQEAKLVRFGYNIDMGTIEIVVDFEHEKRIGFFSFLNMTVTDPTRIKSLELANYFNESLNYGSIIITQTNQIVYKIMFSTFDNPIKDDQWAEIIFRLWSISRDIYPLFGRIVFSAEEPGPIFEEFLKAKEKQHRESNDIVARDTGTDAVHPKGMDNPEASHDPFSRGGGASPFNPNHHYGTQDRNKLKDFRDWFMQN